jgi:hypothetical protein
MATPEPVTLNDYQSIVADYHSESDRAAIVLAGSFVEHCLANYLKHFMIQDESTKPAVLWICLALVGSVCSSLRANWSAFAALI